MHRTIKSNSDLGTRLRGLARAMVVMATFTVCISSQYVYGVDCSDENITAANAETTGNIEIHGVTASHTIYRMMELPFYIPPSGQGGSGAWNSATLSECSNEFENVAAGLDAKDYRVQFGCRSEWRHAGSTANPDTEHITNGHKVTTEKSEGVTQTVGAKFAWPVGTGEQSISLGTEGTYTWTIGNEQSKTSGYNFNGCPANTVRWRYSYYTIAQRYGVVGSYKSGTAKAHCATHSVWAPELDATAQLVYSGLTTHNIKYKVAEGVKTDSKTPSTATPDDLEPDNVPRTFPALPITGHGLYYYAEDSYFYWGP